MFRPLDICIGLRYTRAKRRNHFISFIAIASMLGIALGVLVMITVLSVMNGFQKEVRERILSAASHATIHSTDGYLSNWRGAANQALAHPRVVGAAPFLRTEGMFTFDGSQSFSFVRGVDPERERSVSEIHEKMILGSMDDLRPGEFGVVLGRYLARSIGAFVGAKVTLLIPTANVTPAGVVPRMKRFTVVGIFEVGHNEYDSALAIIHRQDAAKLLRLNDEITGVRIKLDDMFAAPFVRGDLLAEMPPEYAVTDWTQRHANYFRAVQIEKRMMFIILTSIIAVAAFNIVSTMVMAVTEKESDIAILRTLGATPGSIMRIFVTQGTLIGLFGALIGMAGGVGLALNIETIVPAIEQALGLKFLSPDVYLISELPSDLHWDDVYRVTGSAFLLTLFATLYPAWRAARVQPAEALRYE